MLITALILAVIGLAALITAVVTSNELIAWVCIGASSLGILLLIVDAIRERFRRPATPVPAAVAPAAVAPAVVAPATEAIAPAEIETTEVIEPVEPVVDVVEEETPSSATDFTDESGIADSDIAVEDHPDEVVHDEPDYDLPTDDEAEYPEPAEEAALHIVSDDDTVEYVDDAYDIIAEDDTAITEGYDTAVTEGYVIETVEDHLGSDDADSATEIRYIPSAEGSADTVYTYSESSETKYIEAQESEVTDGTSDSGA